MKKAKKEKCTLTGKNKVPFKGTELLLNGTRLIVILPEYFVNSWTDNDGASYHMDLTSARNTCKRRQTGKRRVTSTDGSLDEPSFFSRYKY